MCFSDMDEGFADSERPGGCTLKLEGRPLSLEIRDCKVCLGGEFAGNVDLVFACDADAEERLVSSLTLRVPGDPDPLDVVGSGPASEGFEPSAGLLGDVHLRSDGLHLKEFHSDLSARRFAAQVAYSLGVRVLDTSESAG
jgi:hypothetical protein